jgi:hypothetical protein
LGPEMQLWCLWTFFLLLYDKEGGNDLYLGSFGTSSGTCYAWLR